MPKLSTLKPPRTFKPSLASLEQRLTPTVNSLLVAGLAPSPTETGKIAIVGVFSESNHNLLPGMSLTYTVTDSNGHVISTGSLKMGKSLPHSTLTSFSGTASFQAAPGDVETITVDATEPELNESAIRPNQSFGLSATAILALPKAKGITNMGLGASESNGDLYSGSAEGRLSVTPIPGGGLVARGSGAIRFASDPHNDSQIAARGDGNFTFGIGPNGNIGLIVDKGRGMLTAGTDAGDTTATSGLTLKAAGHINITRYADQSIGATADGSIALSARTGPDSTDTSIAGTGRNLKIALKTDGHGRFKLGLAGKLNLNGNLGSGLGLGLG